MKDKSQSPITRDPMPRIVELSLTIGYQGRDRYNLRQVTVHWSKGHPPPGLGGSGHTPPSLVRLVMPLLEAAEAAAVAEAAADAEADAAEAAP